MPVIQLHGCSLEPLGDYLKALGVFRLVAQQIDPDARCWWRHGIFHLWLNETACYPRQGNGIEKRHSIPVEWEAQEEWLEKFFLEFCTYSPLIAPWQKNTGYLPFAGEAKRERGLVALRTITGTKRTATSAYHRSIREYARAFGRTLPTAPNQSWVDELRKIRDDPLFAGLNSTEQGKRKGLKSATVSDLLNRTRSACPDPRVSAWLDVVGHPERLRSRFLRGINWFSLLGEGAGEGSGGMIVTLEVALQSILTNPDREHLRAALYGSPAKDYLKPDFSIGLFYPSRKGDPNLGQAFEGSRRGSAWDVIFLFEGVLLFAGSLSRRLNARRAVPAFPFYCASSLGGNPAGAPIEISGSERGISSGEVWCPVWNQPASLRDLTAIFSEGRMQVGGRDARLATQFIRALGRHGCDRGIAAFQRYGLLRRSGSFGKQDQTSTLAVPLGLYTPRANSALALLDDLFDFEEAVLDAQGLQTRRLQPVTDLPSRPRRLISARRQFEEALFAASQSGIEEQRAESRDGVSDFQSKLIDVAIAAARLEREFAITRGRIHTGSGEMPDTSSPPNASTAPVLSFDWLRLRHENPDEWPNADELADDGGAEWRLARAVGTVTAWGKLAENSRRSDPAAVGPVRENLVPVVRQWDRTAGDWRWSWEAESRRPVWSQARTLIENFAAVAHRRLVDAERGAGDGVPMFSRYGANAQDLLALWKRELDEPRLAALLHAFALIRTWKRTAVAQSHTPLQSNHGEPIQDSDPVEAVCLTSKPRETEDEWRNELAAFAQLPRPYALLKLCFVGGRLPPRPGARRTGNEPFAPGHLQILNLLLARRGNEACDLAARRLFIAGYPPLYVSAGLASSEFHLPPNHWERIAGLLLVPIRRASTLCRLIIKPTEEPNL